MGESFGCVMGCTKGTAPFHKCRPTAAFSPTFQIDFSLDGANSQNFGQQERTIQRLCGTGRCRNLANGPAAFLRSRTTFNDTRHQETHCYLRTSRTLQVSRSYHLLSYTLKPDACSMQ